MDGKGSIDTAKGLGAGISVLVVGAGPAGLVNARTLIQDGFDVTIVCRVSFEFVHLRVKDAASPVMQAEPAHRKGV